MAGIAFLAERMRLGFGVDLMVDQIASGLAERGHDVSVFTCYTDGTYDDRPYRIIPLRVPSHPEAVVWDGRARAVARASGLYDVPNDLWFVLTPPFFSLLPRLGGRGVAVDCGVSDSTGMSARQRRNFRTTEMLQQHVYFRSAARIVTISDWLRRQLPGFLRGRTACILLGGDHYPVAGPAGRAAARANLGVADDEVLTLYVGRLNAGAQPYKGTERLLKMHREVADSHPKARLAMVGFGDEADAEWIRAHGGIPVVNAPVEAMPEMLAAADVYATASSWEGFDLPLVEAQRSGTPVVAFRIGAHPEVVDDRHSGFLVDDDTEFVASLRRLVGEPSLRSQVGAAASTWAARFSWDRTVAQYDDLVHELLDEKGVVLPSTDRPSRPTRTSIAVRNSARVHAASSDGGCFGHPPVSALVLNYEADADVLTRCVASVLGSRCRRVVEVLVVDNGSTRQTAALDAVAALDSRVRVVRLGRNHGFAGGINRGLALCAGELIFVLNNDTEVDPTAIDACAGVLTGDSSCLAAVPKLVLRRFPGVLDAVGNAVDGMGRAYNVGVGQIDVGQYDCPARVFGPCFAAALFRREAFDVDHVGPLDEAYFMYYEDVDWNWRANLFGYRFLSAPGAVVRHEHSHTVRRQPNEFKFSCIQANLLTTVVKNMSGRTAIGVASHHIAGHLAAAVRGEMPGTRLRILAQAMRRMPDAVVKQRWIRYRRAIPDEDVLALPPPPAGFFDTEAYAPVLDLRNIATAYHQKWRITGDTRWKEISDRAGYLAAKNMSTEAGALRRLLLPLLDGEPAVVQELVRRLDQGPPGDTEGDSIPAASRSRHHEC